MTTATKQLLRNLIAKEFHSLQANFNVDAITLSMFNIKLAGLQQAAKELEAATNA